MQASTDWLHKAGFSPGEVLEGLRRRIGSTGALVMPAYPCLTTHREYLSGQPIYDVRRTPAATGLVAEVFRRSDEVRRSLDPDFCIAACGRDAEELVETHLEDQDPFGRASTYERLIARSATLLGLGVSLNTNSFIHVIDSRLQASYRVHPYGASFDTTVIDYSDRALTVRRRSLAPAFQQLTRPSEVVAALDRDPATFCSANIGSAVFFRWDLQRWARWCQAHGEDMVGQGRLPCWLVQVERECVPS